MDDLLDVVVVNICARSRSLGIFHRGEVVGGRAGRLSDAVTRGGEEI